MGFSQSPGQLTFADQWLNAKVIHANLPMTVIGEIAEGEVTVEFDKACFSPNTQVSLISAGHRLIQGSIISTSVIGFSAAIHAIIDGSETEETRVGGTLLLANGLYRKDDGILIARGSEAIILAGRKAIAGKTSEEIRIATDSFEKPGGLLIR